MAQANVVNITSEASEKSAERLARDAKLADAFRDMESNLMDLRYMARIALEQANEATQDIYADRIDDRQTYDRMLFAVGHVEDMINDLYRKWKSNFQKRIP